MIFSPKKEKKSINITLNIEIFQNNGNETKSDIFSCDILKSDVIFLFINKIKDFNDFQNQNFVY